MSWPHNETLALGDALRVLQELVIRFSDAIHPEAIERRLPIFQIWLEPPGAFDREGIRQPIVVLRGEQRLDREFGNWAIEQGEEQALMIGGRVFIRLHVWQLIDERGDRPFSATPMALLRRELPRMPGGVLESWFYLTR